MTNSDRGSASRRPARRAGALTLLLVPLLGGCASTAGVHGSGVRATEVRAVEPFRRVQVAGHFDVDVAVGGPAALELSGDDNLLPHVISEVEHGTLVLRLEDGTYHERCTLRARIATPVLESLSFAGSGSLRASGVHGPSFRVETAGSAEVRAAGRVERLEASIAGSGHMDLTGLAATSAHVSIAGSGDVALRAAEELDASVAGSGDVRYYGRPRVRWSNAGSGSLRRAGD